MASIELRKRSRSNGDESHHLSSSNHQGPPQTPVLRQLELQMMATPRTGTDQEGVKGHPITSATHNMPPGMEFRSESSKVRRRAMAIELASVNLSHLKALLSYHGPAYGVIGHFNSRRFPRPSLCMQYRAEKKATSHFFRLVWNFVSLWFVLGLIKDSTCLPQHTQIAAEVRPQLHL